MTARFLFVLTSNSHKFSFSVVSFGITYSLAIFYFYNMGKWKELTLGRNPSKSWLKEGCRDSSIL